MNHPAASGGYRRESKHNAASGGVLDPFRKNKMGSKSGTTSHMADLGLWVRADSDKELFAAAAIALAELMYQGSRDGALEWLPFSTGGADQAELMVHLLSEVVYLADAEQRLVTGMQIEELSDTGLTAKLGVIALDPARHSAGEPVKAVTYHHASVLQTGGQWEAKVVLDI
jgi:SHS2 domain-containing protein